MDNKQRLEQLRNKLLHRGELEPDEQKELERLEAKAKEDNGR